MTIRYRTCGDMPITGAAESVADDLTKIIEEIATTRTTERGGRADDKRAETAMEDRKKQGYFQKAIGQKAVSTKLKAYGLKHRKNK